MTRLIEIAINRYNGTITPVTLASSMMGFFIASLETTLIIVQITSAIIFTLIAICGFSIKIYEIIKKVKEKRSPYSNLGKKK